MRLPLAADPHLLLTHVIYSISVQSKAVLAVWPVDQLLDAMADVFGQFGEEDLAARARSTDMKRREGAADLIEQRHEKGEQMREVNGSDGVNRCEREMQICREGVDTRAVNRYERGERGEQR